MNNFQSSLELIQELQDKYGGINKFDLVGIIKCKQDELNQFITLINSNPDWNKYTHLWVDSESIDEINDTNYLMSANSA